MIEDSQDNISRKSNTIYRLEQEIVEIKAKSERIKAKNKLHLKEKFATTLANDTPKKKWYKFWK